MTAAPPEQEPDDTALLRLLGNVKLFRGFLPSDLTELLTVAEKRVFDPEEEVFHEGDPGNSFYILLSGLVQVNRASRGRAVILAHLRPGESFGEMAVVENGTRSATVRVKEKTVTLRFTSDLLSQVPLPAAKLYQNIARVLAERLKTSNDALLYNRSADLQTTAQFKPTQGRVIIRRQG